MALQSRRQADDSGNPEHGAAARPRRSESKKRQDGRRCRRRLPGSAWRKVLSIGSSQRREKIIRELRCHRLFTSALSAAEIVVIDSYSVQSENLFLTYSCRQ